MIKITILLKVYSQIWQEKTLHEKDIYFKTHNGMHNFIKKYAHRITILSIENI
jgi:hypothetical protein